MAGLLHDATRPPISLLFELVSLGADVGVGKLPGVELARMRGSATTGFSDPVARGYVTTAGSPARDAQIWAPMTGFACQPPPPPSGSGLPLLLSVQAHLLAVPGRGDTTSFSPTVSPLSFHSPPLPSI